MRKFIVFITVLLLLSGIGYVAFKQYRIYSTEIVNNNEIALSKIKAPLVDIRVNLIALRDLDPNGLDFVSDKETLLVTLEKANESLVEAYVNYPLSADNRNLFYKLVMKIHEFKIDLHKTSTNKIAQVIRDFRMISAKTQPIYAIYLPSDYEKYNVDYANYYKGELQDTKIFTDVKEGLIALESPKFETDELVHRLEELQILFEDCLVQIGSESIAFEDLAECEDTLAVGELKELAYYTELTYFNNEDVLQLIVDITNDIQNIDFELSTGLK